MKKYGKTIVFLVCILGLAASLAMNVVLLRKTASLRLLDVADVGLAPFCMGKSEKCISTRTTTRIFGEHFRMRKWQNG